MNPIDIAFKKTFLLKSPSLEGLMYQVNYYEDRGCNKSGTIFFDNGSYVQMMENKNAGIPY